MKKFKLLLMMLFFGWVGNVGYAQSEEPNPSPQTTTVTQTTTTAQTTENTVEKNSICDTKMAMRKLWEDHIAWTRNFIISDLAGLQDKEAVTNELLKNQNDIGNAIKPYYGDAAGNELTKLLREHILISATVVDAAKENNKTALDSAQQKWTQNADQIATFLSNANPNWNKKDLLDELQMHLDFTTQETLARLQKNWQADITAYNDKEAHMLKFSDELVDGIAKQFPEKFSN